MPEDFDRGGRLVEWTLAPWCNLRKLLQKCSRLILAIFWLSFQALDIAFCPVECVAQFSTRL